MFFEFEWIDLPLLKLKLEVIFFSFMDDSNEREETQ
jgi:hypothetical protein